MVACFGGKTFRSAGGTRDTESRGVGVGTSASRLSGFERLEKKQ